MHIEFVKEIVFPTSPVSAYQPNTIDENNIRAVVKGVYERNKEFIDANDGYISVEPHSKDEVFYVKIQGNEKLLDAIQAGELNGVFTVPFASQGM